MANVEPYRTDLNAGNAYWMARIAKAVYYTMSKKDKAPDAKKILQDLKGEDGGFRSVKGYDKDSAQAALVEHKDYFCFAFRGTDETLDWLDNIDAFSRQELFGEFHRGFWHSVDDVWDGLMARYHKLSTKRSRPVFFTGHSLGGAMATVAAAKFIHADKPFSSVYTFGQPRAMTRDTARIFNVECKERFFRFHNNNDLVTRVPARVMGYSHVGSYVYISQEKLLHRDPGFWFRFLDYVDGAREAFMKKGIDGVADHSMDNYLAAVKSWSWGA